MSVTGIEADPGSFRDPAGFVYYQGGELYRRINPSYWQHYDALLESGLYYFLVEQKWLVAHDELEADAGQQSRTIKPVRIPFISYPYEWCFSQLKDAALLTLTIQRAALEHGLTLKDASAYNVQFHQGRPVFIDTLSFERYQEGLPWVAYQQFCKHFLGPLALMAYCDVRLARLQTSYVDGIPLDLVASLLPARTRLQFGLGIHLHLHARQQQQKGATQVDEKKLRTALSRQAMLALVDNLYRTVEKLRWRPDKTEWDDYYQSNNNYSRKAFADKEMHVDLFLKQSQPDEVWDLGANDGHFSKIAARHASRVISWDVDPVCVERHYRRQKRAEKTNILPLMLDMTNPSPALGWRNQERASFTQRASCDTAMALGLVHHLAIANNLPLSDIAACWATQCRYLIVEFVPKTDSQVKKLLQSREDVFADYHADGFERAFGAYFTLQAKQPIRDSERLLYLFRSSSTDQSQKNNRAP
tara:strand:+ start:943 stop:2361 length:1419 start_codon:yes stop_codon:yes gene_type:complete